MEENIELNKKQEKILNIISEVFIAVMIIVFPLIVGNKGFFKILEIKWYAHVGIMLVYITAILSVLLYFWSVHGIVFFRGKKLSISQILIMCFMLICAISCFASPYFEKYNLFIGSKRGEGLINMLLYGLSFLMVTTFGKFEKRQLIYFSISSILINLVCVLQYFGLNPFNMYQGDIGTHNVSFMGTIGNVDFISAMFCILLPVSFITFVFRKISLKESIVHFISVIMGIFIFQIIDVDSGKIAFLTILILLFPYIILNSKHLYKTLLIGAGIVFGFFVDIVVNLKYYYVTSSLKCEFQFNKIAFALLLCVGIMVLLSYIVYKNEYNLLYKKRAIVGIYIIIAIVIIIGIITLYVKDFSIGKLHEVHEILNGQIKDEYGTYRGFLWKRSIKLIKDSPAIGTGPDSFAIRFMSRYKKDVASIGKMTINDTAANVYLTMLVNIGIVGTFIYIAFISFQVFNDFKTLFTGTVDKKGYTSHFILSMTVICCLVQDMFNLWVVIVTPVFFVLLAVCSNAYKIENK